VFECHISERIATYKTTLRNQSVQPLFAIHGTKLGVRKHDTICLRSPLLPCATFIFSSLAIYFKSMYVFIFSHLMQSAHAQLRVDSQL
jgi:hypothetical protein